MAIGNPLPCGPKILSLGILQSSKINSYVAEPGAGTDAQGCQTKAVLDGEEWILNGSKCFITNGKEADIYIVIAVTDVKVDALGIGIPMNPIFCIFSTVPLGNFSVSSTSCARGFTSFSANSILLCAVIRL